MNQSRINAGIEIDAVCDDFEEDWLPSNRPNFDSYLLRVAEPLRPRLLIQLVRVDLALRSQAKQTINKDDYQSLGPDAVSIAKQHIDLSSRNTHQSPFDNQDNGQRKIKKPSVRGFQFIELVSEGGMGSVWRARQIEPVKRDVAVKFIKSGIDSEQVVKRFRAEQQALAMMEHENIAKVLDAGTTHENSPYFVMEFVDGNSITEYCNHHQLTLEQRLELFVPVCEAVQHAHQKGVIHRDLKPSNVMVTLRDGKPQIKIIDFGLAKAIADHEALTSQSMQTQIGQILGTLQYMSPEQARAGNAEIDTRTDVYSLGVILYELLTDSTPLDVESLAGKDIFEISQRIQTQDPKAPSSRIREVSVDALQSLSSERSINANRLFDAVRGEMDWIVLKAIDLDRERRYESPRSLSKDIQRFLDSEPIEAAPPSATYRLQKFIRRNKGLFISTCVVFAALTVGLVLMSIGFVAASNRATQAKIANDSAQLRLQQLAKSNDILASVFNDLNVREVDAGDVHLRAALIENLRAVADEIKADAIGDPLTTARMQHQVGRAFLAFDFPEDAIGLLAPSWKTSSEHLGPDQPTTITRMLHTSAAYRIAERWSDADQLNLKIQNCLEGYSEDDPMHIEFLTAMGDTMRGSGKINDSVPWLEKAWRLSQQTFGVEQPETLNRQSDLALAYVALHKFDVGIPMLKSVLSIRQSTQGQQDVDTLDAHKNLAAAQYENGNYDTSLETYRTMLPDFKAKYGESNTNTINVMIGMAASYSGKSNFNEAIHLLETANDLALNLPESNATRIRIMANLAANYARNQQLEKAVILGEKALALSTEHFGSDHVQTIRKMVNLTSTYKDLQKYEQALPLAKKAYSLAIDHMDIEHSLTRDATNNLAMIHRLTNDSGNYVGTWNRLFDLQKEKLGVSSETTIITGKDLAMKYLNLKDYKGALDVIQEVFEASRDHLGISHPTTKDILRRTAFLNLRLRRFDDAIKWLQLSLEAWQKDDPDNWEVHTLNSMVGEAELGLGNYERAEKLIVDAYESLLVKMDRIPAGARVNVIDSVLHRAENLYGQWHRAQPSEGHDQSMKKWQQTRVEWRNSSGGS